MDKSDFSRIESGLMCLVTLSRYAHDFAYSLNTDLIDAVKKDLDSFGDAFTFGFESMNEALEELKPLISENPKTQAQRQEVVCGSCADPTCESYCID